jgi:OFA family oxalate/formate antiporter-like MFS transporter
VLFVVLSALVFFGWGEIYSLFPSTCADTYGWKYASANAGALYTAKGTGSLFVPLALIIAKSTSWNTVFLIAAAMSGLAAIMALAVLKPMRARMLARNRSPDSAVAESMISDNVADSLPGNLPGMVVQK